MPLSIRCTQTGQKVEGNAAEKSEKENRYYKCKFGNAVVVSWVVYAKCLQHAPKAMAQMQGKSTEGKNVKDRIREITEIVLNEL